MKLLNFYTAKDQKAMGLADGDRVLNLSSASGHRPEFASVGAWLHSGQTGADMMPAIRERAAEDSSFSLPLAGLRHARLVEADARIFCVGLNYADHAAENNLPPPASPIFFAKLASVVIPHFAPIPKPAITEQLDYEAEFAVVIGKRADRVREDGAKSCIAGFSIMNDVTARDLQVNDKQWFRSKNCNGFGPLGPWLVTSDDVPDPLNLEVKLRVNGEQRQHSNTRNLVFGPEALISILSQTLVLHPGDVISTGTPAGIGFHRKPPVFLGAGDRIEVEISGIGVLENVVASADAGSRAHIA
jgi:2-keto-4-pentenoate hydratase/2-oxohepta-3-ene-1,7-dioic acid hydratase in catechol pathway